MIGDIVLGILGRTVRLGVCIDAEHRVVAGLARPHPVVRFTTILTHRLGNGEHQAHIVEVAVGGAIVLVTLVERLYFHTQRRVFLAYILLPGILDAVDNSPCLFRLMPFRAGAIWSVTSFCSIMKLTNRSSLGSSSSKLLA